MPTYTYVARDQQGTSQAGRVTAAGEDEAVVQLQHRGLIVTSLDAKDPHSGPGSVAAQLKARRMHRGVKTEDQVQLCQQLSTLLEAGVPILRSLEVVVAQVESSQLLKALLEVHHDVEAGTTFRNALAKHPQVFSKLWVNLVETGEASGHLAESLQHLARHFESVEHLHNEAKTALTYPAVLVTAALGVLAFFVYWLIPRFTGALLSSGMTFEMPALTLVVMKISEIARRYVLLVVAVGGGGVYLIIRYLQTDMGRLIHDRVMLQVPLFKGFFSWIQLSEFSWGLATLLKSGLPLLPSLRILADSASNKLYGQAIGELRDAVREGKSMTEPMRRTGMFPPMMLQMVEVGEEVGELPKMAERMARHYERRVETFIARMTRLFEPIAIVLLGGVILVIVLAIFLPIFKMATSARVM